MRCLYLWKSKRGEYTNIILSEPKYEFKGKKSGPNQNSIIKEKLN